MAGKVARMTKQRRIIMDCLSQTASHPTADEVYELVRSGMPRISLGTVYRNLELLSAQGLVRVLDQGPGQRRFDGDMTPHFHGRCLQCGAVIDLERDSGADVQQLVAYTKDFEISGYRLEFVGSCMACKQTTIKSS